MKLEITKQLKKKLKKLVKSNPSLKQSLKKQLTLFQTSPNHPSLRLHKLQGKRCQQLAIWIKGDLRALLIKSPTKKDTYVFFDLIKHKQY
ncbi:hypothetical protein ACFLZP_01670 [Patescibacteria group bacterium]